MKVVGCNNFALEKQTLMESKHELIEAANAAYASIVGRGGGANDLDVRILNDSPDSEYKKMLVLHLYVDTCDAMGANIINTMVESLAPMVEDIASGKMYLRILSNFADRCVAKA